MYVLVAIIKKRLDLEASLYTILKTLRLALFEKSHQINYLQQGWISPPTQCIVTN